MHDFNIDVAPYAYNLDLPQGDLAALSRRLVGIEDDVIRQVYQLCLATIETKGTRRQGNLFLVGSRPYQLFVDLHPTTRVLSVLFYPTLPSRSEPERIEIKVAGFGRIRKVHLAYPKVLARLLAGLDEMILEAIRLPYHWLELQVLNGFKSLGELLLDQLFDPLRLEIERANRPDLLGGAWLDLTTRKDDQFRYLLDRRRLEEIIEHFKANQIPEWSPAELVITLIVDQARHTMNMLMEIPVNEIASLEARDFVSLDENNRFWQAEALMIDYKTISAFTVWKNDRLILQFSCDRRNEAALAPIFRQAAPVVAERFRKNIKQYTKYARDLSSVPPPKHHSPARDAWASTVGTVLGSAIAELIKKLARG